MRVLSVTEFIHIINELVHIEELVVEGEVSQFSVRGQQWVFFSLKDEQSVLECFSVAYRINVPIDNGMKVRVHGYPSIHGRSGRFRFTVMRIEPVGEGALLKAYCALKKKLEGEGLFALERKRPLPQYPMRVGFIGSAQSAAYTDFLRIAGNRWGGSEVQLYDVRVQGETAVEEIITALQFFNKLQVMHTGRAPEVVVLARGGGSLEDLHAFNDERVARAIYGSLIPVVVGVGHEKDESLADFVADVRASTPSNGAERVFPDRVAVAQSLFYNADFLQSAIAHVLVGESHRLDRAMHVFEQGMTAACGVVTHVCGTFLHTFDRFMLQCQTIAARVGECGRMIISLNPLAILKKGYSITYDVEGTIIRKAAALAVGSSVRIQLGEGQVCARVEKKGILPQQTPRALPL